VSLLNINCNTRSNASEPEDEKSPPKVLVVDDSEPVRESITWLLCTSGYQAVTANDGKMAKALLAMNHFALIITDLKMPVCDGWELLTFCHQYWPSIPVLVISGNFGRRPDLERLASGFLCKPFDFLQLRAEINRLLPSTAQPPDIGHRIRH
jgi:DNA-binding response OmpR family regulator